jgi:hypothetical protein
MGNSSGTRQASAYAINHVIYEWQLFTGHIRLRLMPLHSD